MISQKESYVVYQTWILLERNGTHLMDVESAEGAIAFAAENGLELLRPPFCVREDVLVLECKANASLADFYTWSEVPAGSQPMREVWRPFLWSRGEGDLGLWAPLQEIQIGPDGKRHTVGAVLSEATAA